MFPVRQQQLVEVSVDFIVSSRSSPLSMYKYSDLRVPYPYPYPYFYLYHYPYFYLYLYINHNPMLKRH